MKKRNVEGGVVYGDLFFMNGCCNFGDSTNDETRKNMEELKELIENAGATMEDVLKTTVYFKDLNDRERGFSEIWSEYFPANPPARTCVEAGSGKCRIEIEFVVALPEK